MKNKSNFIINNLWLLTLLASLILLWKHIIPLIVLLIFAYVGVIILTPSIIVLDKIIKKRKVSVIIVMSILLFFIIILSGSLFPFLSNQIISFQNALTLDTTSKFFNKLMNLCTNFLPAFVVNILTELSHQYSSYFLDTLSTILFQLKTFIGSAGTIIFALGSAFFSLIIILVFMVMLLVEGDKLKNIFFSLIHSDYQSTVASMLEKISNQINYYIIGQLLAASSVAITSIIGLYILQWLTGIIIPYTVLIGIIAGLFNLIPFAGPIIGTIPAIIFYLVTDQPMQIELIYVLFIMGNFIIVQLIDNFIMSPYIMGASIGIHPLLVIIIVLLGASVGGILGMLLAIPTVVIIKVIINELIINFGD